MTDNEEAQTLRRSTRVRKQISYRALAGSPDPDPKATAEATPQRKRKARDDSDREDSYELQAEDGELERRRTSFFKKSRDAKFYVLSGENDKKKTKFAVQMKAWKNVLTKVPEALCDYTIGWGVCEGHWGANGGQTQVFERAEGVRDEGMETTLRLLLGPKKSQKSVELDRYRNVMLSSYFPKRRGNIVNVGQSILTLDFAPQSPSSDSQVQYLAVGGRSENSDPRIYVREAYPNVIQLWAIEEESLYLSTLIHHSWGTCWGLKFCPYGAEDENRLGFLACTFGDGVARVLDIRKEWLGTTDQIVNISVTQPAYQYSFPDDCFITCCAWKSHTELLVGCSTGFVAIFDLSDETEEGNIPTLYKSLSDTYILGVVSFAPSHPYFIAVASFDGSCQIFDIRSPESESSLVCRQRGPCHFVSHLPFWDGILCPDELVALRYSSFRQFKKGTMISSHEGPMRATATSEGGPGSGVHPLVLTAGSDGICAVTSPTNRLFGGSKLPGRKILFRLERTEQTWKMTEQFDNQTQDLHPSKTEKDFDKEIAVSSVAWCMNKGYLGWYAAGMRSGLLRIEDLNYH